MNKIFKKIIDKFDFTGDLKDDSLRLLKHYNCAKTAEHSEKVANECKVLAKEFGVDDKLAQIAGYLHDISAVISHKEKLEVAKLLDIEILEEEEEVPLLLHQKISAIMAQEIWGIDNENILNAISCHTTLKKNPSKLDMVLFIADKIKWDQNEEPPYMGKVKRGLENSLKEGIIAFLKYQLENKDNLLVVHPWLLEAYNDLKLMK